MNLEEFTLDIEQHIDVRAPIDSVFEGVVRQLSERSNTPDGTPMPLVLERRPGGRWYRDMGGDAGHLWGHVQVIKPPRLLELTGPLFMSYPAANHVQVRLEEQGDVTRITLRHQALGRIDPNHRAGVSEGWRNYLTQTKSHCE